MKRNRILIILFAILITTGAKAQLKETIQQILGSDSTQTISSATSSDSIRIKQMQQELETARLKILYSTYIPSGADIPLKPERKWMQPSSLN